MATKRFAATVDAWVKDSIGAAEAILRQSANDVVDEIQRPVGDGGLMPVDTGFLRASIFASLNGELASKGPRPKGALTVPYVDAPIVMTIAQAQLGDVITFSYGAEYAVVQENKWAFVRRGGQRWQQIVDRNVKELASRRAAR